jgi:hypothetical protein
MKKEIIIKEIRKLFYEKTDFERVKSVERFFKGEETVKVYGLKSVEVKAIAKSVFQQVKIMLKNLRDGLNRPIAG